MKKRFFSKENSNEQEKNRHTEQIKGLILLVSVSIILLSLISFKDSLSSQNWLGLLGYIISWILYFTFGVSSYILAGCISWFGWRMLCNKPISSPKLKIICMSILIVSSCFLLNLVEDASPVFKKILDKQLHPDPSELKLRRMNYHLGGNPFYYIYKDIPFINLHYMLNRTGIFLIFFTIFISSILYLSKIHLDSLLNKLLLLRKGSLNGGEENSTNSSPQDNPSLIKPEISKPMTIENRHEKKHESIIIPPPPYQDLVMTNSNFKTNSGQDLINSTTEEINSKPSVKSSFSRKSSFEPPSFYNLPDSFKQQRAKEISVKPISMERIEKKEEKAEDSQALKKAISMIEASQSDSIKNSLVASKRENALAAQRVYNGDFSNYRLPSLDLLTNAKKIDQTLLIKDLRRQAEVLEETLLSFGIEAKVGQINCGPTITSFEVHPAVGVKVQKIKTLENDIALNMEAKSIRIIAPIPGKAAVGIEVPNAQAQEVGFKEMLATYHSRSKFHIPVLLGKTVAGEYVMSDLAKMPHCIIAGATGSGKSVCINTIVMSILMNARPDEIRLIMVDPKKVELTPYTRLPHMLAPVITEPQGAAAALNWLVKEMEKRYEILKLTGARNIEGFNNRKVNKELEESLDIEIPNRLPYYVGIVDELADLMMVSSHDIETPIARIAQMARAVGIHLILATQRPSREVITGLIKANFPTRISFKVASRINSQIVLDETGAEALLGNGDMLFLPPGSSHLIRAQGAFIRDEDINRVIEFICEQSPPKYVIDSFDHYIDPTQSDQALREESSLDPLYEQAKEIILKTGNASTTFLQRKLKIGYARAASLIDQLEEQKIISPADGSKPRKILAARMYGKDEDMPEFEDRAD